MPDNPSNNGPGNSGTPQGGVPDIRQTPEYQMALLRLGVDKPEDATDVETMAAAGLAYAAVLQRDGAQYVSQFAEQGAEQRLVEAGLGIAAKDMDPQWRARAKAVGLDSTSLVAAAAQVYPDEDLTTAMARLRRDLSTDAARRKTAAERAADGDDGWTPARAANSG